MLGYLLSAALVAPGAEAPRVFVDAPEQLRWLAAQLVEEGYTLAPEEDGATIDLRVEPDPATGWVVTATGVDRETFVVEVGDDLAVARLELLHRAVDALEAVEPRSVEPPAPPERSERAEPSPAEETPASWRDPRLVLRGGVAAGVVLRALRPDPNIGGSLFLGREPGPSLWVDLQVFPSANVVEAIPALGLRLRAQTQGRLSVDLGGLVGVYTQRYDFVIRGTLVDVSGEAALGFAVAFWRGHEFFALARFGGVRRTYAHRLGLETLWRRVAWRFGLQAGITFGRRLRR